MSMKLVREMQPRVDSIKRCFQPKSIQTGEGQELRSTPKSDPEGYQTWQRWHFRATAWRTARGTLNQVIKELHFKNIRCASKTSASHTRILHCAETRICTLFLIVCEVCWYPTSSPRNMFPWCTMWTYISQRPHFCFVIKTMASLLATRYLGKKGFSNQTTLHIHCTTILHNKNIG